MNKKTFIKVILIIMLMLIGIGISINIYAVEEDIESDVYKVISLEGKEFLFGIYQNTRVSEINKNIEQDIKIYTKEDKEMLNTEIVKTGSYIVYGQKRFYIIVCGDLTGDGKVSLTDLVVMKNEITKKGNLEKIYKIASDINLNGTVSSTDLLYLKKLIVRIIEDREIYEEDKENEQYKYSVNKIIKKVTIKEAFTTVGQSTLAIPNQIEENEVIAIDSLGKNNSTTKIVIPKEIKKINGSAFNGLISLRDIQVDSENKNYSSEDGVLFNKAKEEIILYPQKKIENEYTLPKTIKVIGQWSFSNVKNLKKLHVDTDVNTILSKAFDGFTGTIYAKKNTNIINYAKTNKIKYVEVSETLPSDTVAPEINNIKVISPVAGIYTTGQKLAIRIQFTEKIKGTVPVLKLNVGTKLRKRNNDNFCSRWLKRLYRLYIHSRIRR